MYYFIYETTNLINGKKYIGKHITDNLDDGYLGSGIVIQNAIKKYGRENFKREILEFCENEEMCYKLEYEYIKNANAYSSSNYYNLSEGGKGFTSKFAKDLWERDGYREHMNKEKIKLWQKEEYRKHMSEVHKGQEVSEENREKMRIRTKERWENGELRIKHKIAMNNLSPEKRKNLSNAQKRKWGNEEYKEKMRQIQIKSQNDYKLKEKRSEYWKNNNPMYIEETRNKISKIRSKRVICLNTLQIFKNAEDVVNKVKEINNATSIRQCCREETKYSGIDTHTNKPLLWKYYNEECSLEYYKNIYEKEKDDIKIQATKRMKVVCITTGEIFDTVTKAANKYGVNTGRISECCKGKREFVNTKEGLKLKFEYIK